MDGPRNGERMKRIKLFKPDEEYFRVTDVLILLSQIKDELDYFADRETKMAVKKVIDEQGVFDDEDYL